MCFLKPFFILDMWICRHATPVSGRRKACQFMLELHICHLSRPSAGGFSFVGVCLPTVAAHRTVGLNLIQVYTSNTYMLRMIRLLYADTATQRFAVLNLDHERVFANFASSSMSNSAFEVRGDNHIYLIVAGCCSI